MANLETEYLGLKLKSPIIVSSSGLTNSVEKIKKLADQGAGAVVLKSLFEEQINSETGDLLRYNEYPEAEDYIREYSKNNTLQQYVELITAAKKACDIPIIASINCISEFDWRNFAKRIEHAGADAIELNIHIVPVSKTKKSEEIEDTYFSIIRKVTEKCNLPIAVKIGSHFSNPLYVIDQIVGAGAKGVVLFNRFYEPDIDIKSLRFTSAEIFSNPADIRTTLRWVGLTSSFVKNVEISASTGVHSGEAAIKLLLAGAQTVQVASAIYRNGYEVLSKMQNDIVKWMDEKAYTDINRFRGMLSYKIIENPTIYERAQFMRYFSSIE